MSELKHLLMEVREELKHIREPLGGSSESTPDKTWFNTAEASTILGTTREYFRLGRIPARKTATGRGRNSEWRVSKESLAETIELGLRAPTQLSRVRYGDDDAIPTAERNST